jgi:hypothetical protein
MSKAKQFIKDYTKTCSNELCAVEDKYGKKVISYHEWLTPEQALSAVVIEREEVIEEACQYIREHRFYVDTEDNGIAGWIPERFIEDFKEYMNENNV